MRFVILAVCVISLFLVSGCVDSGGDPIDNSSASTPKEKCINLCRSEIENGVDLGHGPCLSEVGGIEWNYPDWSCDVAHYPRENRDNSAINQCQEYRRGETHNFVEVDPYCGFIREGSK